jgi:hypothetical protein
MLLLPLYNKKLHNLYLYEVVKLREKKCGALSAYCVRGTINEHKILVVKPKARDFLESMCLDEMIVL